MTSISANNKSPKKIPTFLLPWLDVLAIGTWGILMIKYWLTGKLYLLIHPDFFWLVIAGGFGLLALSVFKTVELLSQLKKKPSNLPAPNVQHLSVFPPGIGSSLLLITALLGLAIEPQVFSSQTALDRGITDFVSLTRSQPQSFRSNTRPEDRSIIDWVRTLNVYPEPDAYTGQKVKVQGFVIHPPNYSEEYIIIARFILTCCAADAYPVGLPVKLAQNRSAYPSDTWLEIEGEMITTNLGNKRQLTIEAQTLTNIPKPKNPYDY
ncbi:TIGR03943 family protein [Ancylothrix sp. C2]|uniref:TIGR03943 family putative permease subunit n=1 Tax=Ancylothrix sp. D3o TaxID=2953691 RepID=UPI0021BB05D2|nr:TIGR03943 family protein [Ancylothrix sp. D3o]MCT7949847.1 TIGR03943 family protein [Ancylothrix sp. D3o]